MTPSAADTAAIDRAAALLKIPAIWLHRIIKAESNYNPAAANPYSSAKGLIQFTDSTARGLGHTSSAALVAALPRIPEQTALAVYPYLKKHAPFKSQSDFYLSVFNPASRSWPLFKRYSAEIQKANPGIRTPADYFFFVARKITSPLIALVPIGILGAILAIHFSGTRAHRGARKR